jgi:branched-chain amino acid transport system substrate-binding protein
MAQLAVNDINSSGGVLGGRKLKFAIVDDKSDFAANGASAALQTIQDGAKVIVTDCDSGWGAPAQTAAESKGVGSLSWCAGAPQFGVKGGLGALTSSGGIATANEAAVPAEWGYKTQKWRKAYLLYDTTYCSMFRKRFQQLGGAIVGQDQFQQTDSSIATQITRLRATKPAPDVIVLCSVPPGGATAVRQLRAAGINTTLMMSDGMAGNDWLPSVPGLTNAFLSTYAAQDGTDPIAKINQLTKRWRTTYHSAVPIPDVYNAYADIQLIAAAINKAGSDQPKAIALALASTNNVDTVLGKHTFEPGYNLSFTSAVAIIKIAQKKDTFEARQRPEIDAVKLLGK